MKVLSIKEPFPSLIREGYKKIETRSWKTNYRGEIYIHASLTKINLKDERIIKLVSYLKDKNMYYGYITFKCNLVDCIYMDKKFLEDIKKNKMEYLCGHYEEGRYAWVLDNIEILDEKIQAKGKLGIWNL